MLLDTYFFDTFSVTVAVSVNAVIVYCCAAVDWSCNENHTRNVCCKAETNESTSRAQRSDNSGQCSLYDSLFTDVSSCKWHTLTQSDGDHFLGLAQLASCLCIYLFQSCAFFGVSPKFLSSVVRIIALCIPKPVPSTSPDHCSV